METKELLKKVRKIEIKTKGLSNQIFTGEYHSAFRGRGMSFSEVREYQYGDDIRSIDWNVTARFNHPYIKIFEEERELTAMLLVDVSASSQFGSRQQSKDELITEICAVLAFSAIHNNDKVGVLFFTDRIEKFIPPKKGRFHILRIIRELLDFKPEGFGTDLSLALGFFNNVMKKRSIAFLLSDFMATDYQDALSIVSKKHDLIGIRLHDPIEAELPNVGLIRVKDAETGGLYWMDTNSRSVRRAYHENYQRNFQYYKTGFTRAGADNLDIQTDESYVNALMRFFKKRGQRR